MRLNTNKFKKFLSSILPVTSIGKIAIENKTLKFSGTNPGVTSFVEAIMPCDDTDIDEIIVDLARVNDLMKGITSEEFTIEYKDGYKFVGGNTKFSVPKQSLLTTPRQLPPVKLPISVTVSSSDLMARYKTILCIDDKVIIDYNNKNLSMIASDVSIGERIEASFDIISVNVDSQTPAQSTFLPVLLTDIMQSLSSCKNITIDIGQDSVMRLIGHSDELTVTYLVAPCVIER